MVLNGIDRIRDFDSLFKEKKLGVITSQSGLSKDFTPSWKILAERYTVSALFAPEHGLYGCEDAGTVWEGENKSVSGIPLYSLYRQDGQDFKPNMLTDIDTLVYDIQDVGVRFYTYISTLILAMRAASAHGKDFIILDRPNPLGGIKTEGNIVKKDFESFVGMYPLCIRYGLTAAELARMVHSEEQLRCPLHIVPMEHWHRDMLFTETGRVWIPPSPNLPHFDNTLAYPGTALFESTDVSEGRGTANPFTLIGAPYIDAEQLADTMNAAGLRGVHFLPARFTPSASKYVGVLCFGVQLFITDYHTFEPVKTGVTLLFAVKTAYPDDFRFLPPAERNILASIDRLGGDSLLRTASSAAEVCSIFEKEAESFYRHIRPFFIYS